MKRITEKKFGKKSVFTVDTIIAGDVIDTYEVNVQKDVVKVKNKEYYLVYDSEYNLISDAYDYLNHNDKRLSENTKVHSLYALRYLYIFSEIIETPIENFTRKDFIRLDHFLTGVSVNGNDFEYNILTRRKVDSVNNAFSTYREFYRYLGLDKSPILNERSFSKYTPTIANKGHVKRVEVPKFISTEEFAKIVKYIRENIKDKERRLRDECIVRIMYEGGCRIGEVLGSTLEDYVLKEVNDDEMCFVYIRNRYTDKKYQKAKTCMTIDSRKLYNNYGYETRDVGYQLTFLSIETYDLICDYIDIAHDRAYKKYRDNYDKGKADAVGEYKKSNEDNYYLFLNNRGEPLSVEGWNKELRMIFKGVGLQLDSKVKTDNLNHRFRHGFVMHLIYDLKWPREKVKVRSRHKSYASLDYYYNPTTEQLLDMKNEIQDMILDSEENDE